MHTDSLTEYRSKLKLLRTIDGQEIRQQEIVAERVVEQRISHFLMGLAIIGTMTGPLLIVLNLIPRALFGGVFFVVGVSFPKNIRQFSKADPLFFLFSGAVLRGTASWQR